jgi:hypothetical protein
MKRNGIYRYRRIDNVKACKWKMKHQLMKDNKAMTIGDYAFHYYTAYDIMSDRYQEAAFNEEDRKVKFYFDYAYNEWYELEEVRRKWNIKVRTWIKEDLQAMGSSKYEINQEAQNVIEYERNTIKFLEKEMLKKLLEGMINKRIIDYHVKEKKRNGRTFHQR